MRHLQRQRPVVAKILAPPSILMLIVKLGIFIVFSGGGTQRASSPAVLDRRCMTGYRCHSRVFF